MGAFRLISIGLLSLFLNLGAASTALFKQQPAPVTPVAVSTSAATPSPHDTSVNWSGYEISGGTFTGVSGTWIVPASSDTNFGASATWVGIGGISSHDLIQAGTQVTTDRSGGSYYESFFETLPDPSQPLPVTISPGDLVTVSINQTSNNQWHLTFKNNTNGQSAQMDQTYNSSLSSAEWIQEAPSGARHGVWPLNNFGKVSFSNASAVKNGQVENLVQAHAQPITMADFSGQPLAITSGIGSDGASFNVFRTANPSTQLPPRRF